MTLTDEMRAEGWRENSGACPVKDARTKGRVMLQDGTRTKGDVTMQTWRWELEGCSSDIAAYRITEPHGADAVPPHEPASADPHADPATRWESGPDGEFTIVANWARRPPRWLLDDDAVRFRTLGGWDKPRVDDLDWRYMPAFFLRRRPQVDGALVALIAEAVRRSCVPLTSWEAEAVARALVADGCIKEGA